MTVLPYSPSLDVNSMDRDANPCEDFYRYACGSWNKNNPMPPDQATWDVYGKLSFDNQRFLRGLLEEAAKPSENRTSAQQKIGDYYHACMDEASVEKAGLSPIRERLDQVAKLASVADIAQFTAAQHRLGTGDGLIFSFSSGQDPEHAQDVIAFASRGALGLPDRDYYTKTDEKSAEIRDKFESHVAKMFALLETTATPRIAGAKTVISIETKLAESSMPRVMQRNPDNIYHKTSIAQLKTLAPISTGPLTSNNWA